MEDRDRDPFDEGEVDTGLRDDRGGQDAPIDGTPEPGKTERPLWDDAEAWARTPEPEREKWREWAISNADALSSDDDDDDDDRGDVDGDDLESADRDRLPTRQRIELDRADIHTATKLLEAYELGGKDLEQWDEASRRIADGGPGLGQAYATKGAIGRKLIAAANADRAKDFRPTRTTRTFDGTREIVVEGDEHGHRRRREGLDVNAPPADVYDHRRPWAGKDPEDVRVEDISSWPIDAILQFRKEHPERFEALKRGASLQSDGVRPRQPRTLVANPPGV